MSDGVAESEAGFPALVPIDRRLLEVLVCPVTKGTLEYDPVRGELISRQAGLAYPVRDGIPIMLPDEARPLETTPLETTPLEIPRAGP